MRPADASVAILLSVLVSARPSGGHGLVPADGPADSSAPQTADQLGPAKVKRNVRTLEETKMLISDTGYALEILPNGAINTTTDKDGSPYAVLNIMFNKTIKHSGVRRHYTLRGVASGRYLCFSKKRQAFSSKYLRQNRCRFRIVPVSRQYFIVYLYERRQDRRLQLAITKQGAVRVRVVRARKRRRHRKRAGGPPRPTAGDSSAAESATEPTGRQESRRQLPPGSSSPSPSPSSPSPRRRPRPPARQGGRQLRAQRKAHAATEEAATAPPAREKTPPAREETAPTAARQEAAPAAADAVRAAGEERRQRPRPAALRPGAGRLACRG